MDVLASSLPPEIKRRGVWGSRKVHPYLEVSSRHVQSQRVSGDVFPCVLFVDFRGSFSDDNAQFDFVL